jgi:glycerol kinase
MTRYVLAIDQGTTSTRCIVFDDASRPVATAQTEFAQHYPAKGWVEHDVEDIWRDVVAMARQAIGGAGLTAQDISAIGVANQRETVVVWDRATGVPIHRAIVWQDRRTADLCRRLKEDGCEPMVRARTGLLLDPYFSATKLAWILDQVPGARARAERGELAFGTIDSFLVWRLTGGKAHVTDIANAGRTLLFDIHREVWDPELLALFHVPAPLLPQAVDNSGVVGETDAGLFGAPIPIAGMAGDQQAALVGQACLSPGMAKATYGTGCFMLLNTGPDAVTSEQRLLTTPAYRVGGQTTYALEGSIFVAGAAVKWLRDGLGLILKASDTDSLATRVAEGHGVYMVPGFVGLGAPHWDPDARGLICGLTLDATAAHIARAALESVAFQTLDLAEAMRRDGAAQPTALRIDGGMSANSWLCQFLADVLEVPVERPAHLETTALGAAFLAGAATGVWTDLNDAASSWRRRDAFSPKMAAEPRAAIVAGWRKAVARTLL